MDIFVLVKLALLSVGYMNATDYSSRSSSSSPVFFFLQEMQVLRPQLFLFL